jgi:hypothetical protein
VALALLRAHRRELETRIDVSAFDARLSRELDVMVLVTEALAAMA